jgi:hypothetical protein
LWIADRKFTSGKGGYWGTAIVSKRAQWTEREKWQALSMDFHSHARRFFNHLFDSELGLRVHSQAGDLIRNWDIIYLRVKLVTPFLQRFNIGHFLSLLFKLLFFHTWCMRNEFSCVP